MDQQAEYRKARAHGAILAGLAGIRQVPGETPLHYSSRVATVVAQAIVNGAGARLVSYGFGMYPLEWKLGGDGQPITNDEGLQFIEKLGRLLVSTTLVFPDDTQPVMITFHADFGPHWFPCSEWS